MIETQTKRIIHNPISGEQIEILTSGEETNGELLVFRLKLPAGKQVPSGHTHPHQVERFTVQHGQMQFLLGTKSLTASVGETVVVPAGVPHWFGNRGQVEAIAQVEVRPALNLQELFEMTAAISIGELRSPLDWLTQLPRLSKMLLNYQNEVAVPILPGWLARPFLQLMAKFARATQ